MMRRGAVLVGVGSDGAPAAVAYAFAEAISCGCDLHLVHVVDPVADSSGPARDDPDGAGIAVLEAAAAQVRARAAEGLEVTTEVVAAENVASALVQRSEGSTLVVLERQRATATHRVVSGATIVGVAGRSHAPVHVVPQEWVTTTPGHAFVTCGVQDGSDAEMLMRQACLEAERREGGEVVVLRTWAQGGENFDSVVDAGLLGAVDARLQQELAPHSADLRHAFPTVDVTIVVQHARAAEALLRAAERSELLVIGRRHHLLPQESHLGPVARTVLDRSPCPVVVAPETPADVLSSAGATGR